MIEKTNFRSGQDRQEIFSEAAAAAPFRCLYAEKDSLIDNAFPWHWHTAFEIDYVEGCDVQFDFIGQTLTVPQGSAVFINSGEVHSYRPEDPGQCKIYAFLFEPEFLAGSYEGPIYQQYVAPVLRAGTCLAIGPETGQEMLSGIQNILHIASGEPAYYEIKARCELEHFWCGLLESRKGTDGLCRPKDRDGERIKKMLGFIHAGYSQRLTLQDIAASALIGTRECSRCFRRTIGRSPMEYLNQYRVQMAMLQLLTTDKSVTEISECSGFSSIGYFGKVFRQHTGLSPLQYRASV